MTTAQVIKILRELYPHRRFVMSQFTLWIRMGIAHPKITKPFKRHPTYEWSAFDVAALCAHVYLKDLGLDYPHHGDVLGTLKAKGSTHAIHLPRVAIRLDLSGFLDDVMYTMKKETGQNEQRN